MSASHSTQPACGPYVDKAAYARGYAESLRDPDGFWGRIGQRLDWITPYAKVRDTSFDVNDLHIRWYEDGELNVADNCFDRHLAERGDKTAMIWEGDDLAGSRAHQLSRTVAEVCKAANLLDPWASARAIASRSTCR